MNEVPKIVYQRLRAGLSQQRASKEHPNDDLLTAFAEQALSVSERDGILQHLALCEDCREVVALALPATESSATYAETKEDQATVSQTARTPRSSFSWPTLSWPTLRWAGLAAAVVVAASVLLVHPGRLNSPTSVSVAPQVATSTAAQSPIARPVVAQSAPPPLTGSAPSKRIFPTFKKSPAPVVTDLPDAGTMLASNRKNSGPLEKSSALSAPTRSVREAGANSRATNEAMEVSGANGLVENQPSDSNASNTLMAQTDTPPILKAKPALPDQADHDQLNKDQLNKDQTNKQMSYDPSAAASLSRAQGANALYAAKLSSTSPKAFNNTYTWVVKNGILQRSLDSGNTWQDALRADHPLLCSAVRGMDIWAGGEAGTLFLSGDGGATWHRLQPSFGSQVLVSDITQIRTLNSGEVSLSTSNNETWSSLDAGKTWTKK
jgi:hypothetical protein